MDPKPWSPFCAAWYMPRCRKGMISELMMVAIVINPPPPIPVRALITFNKNTSLASAHPRQPIRKEMVQVKKHGRLPKMSEKRPYRG